ncbi:NUDIX hydrolase [Gulosibacter sp. ACHW.36C]|uniref:NUDIX hydrolase n=1 Tax=Gulosibacter sp. ACHW.36C TaxID=3434457 RepID=UPI0032D5A631
MAASLRSLLDQLGNSRSTLFGVTSSAALAALALVEPRGAATTRKLLYRGAIGAVAAWSAVAALRSERPQPVRGKALGAVAAGFAVASATVSPLTERLDAKLVDRLARGGVRRPRVVLAAANGALSLGAWVLDRRSAPADPAGADASIAATEAAAAEAPLRSRIVVSAVVLRDDAGRVLTVRKRGTQRFMFPGGKPEPGETTEQTAVREVREELGIDLDAAQLTHLGDFETDAANEPNHTVVASVFEHPFVEGVAVNAEIDELEWVALDAERADLAPLLADAVFPALRER